MKARRVYADDGSSHIEPPLDQEWSDLEKLKWKAEVSSDDSGLEIHVAPGQYYIEDERQPYFYTVNLPHSSSGPHTFNEAWTHMNGIVSGAQEVRRSL